MLSLRCRARLTARSCTFIPQLGLHSKRTQPSLLHAHIASQRWRSAVSRQHASTGFDSRKSSSEPGHGKHELKLPTESNYIPQTSEASYKKPTTGFISYLPDPWIPYAELARLDKPTGTMYLWYPCIFSTVLAGSMISPIVSGNHMAATIALFLAGAFVMRGAGCTVNDLWDRNLDPFVARTKFRPLARRAVTPLQATVFLSAQLLVGLGILVQFPTSCLYYGIPSLLLVGTYPLAKRVTNYPQFVLGLTFSWGAIMGFPAMGIDLLSDTNALCAAAALYASCVAWTVNYDMVYAHMDLKDDVKAGIKSIARVHEYNTKTVMRGLAMAQVAFLAASELFAGVPWYLLSLHSAAVYFTLDHLRSRVDLKNVASCLDYFKRCAWAVGGMTAVGLLCNFLVKTKQEQEVMRNHQRPTEESLNQQSSVPTVSASTSPEPSADAQELSSAQVQAPSP